MQFSDYVRLAVTLGAIGLLGIVFAALLLGSGLPQTGHVHDDPGQPGTTANCPTEAKQVAFGDDPCP